MYTIIKPNDSTGTVLMPLLPKYLLQYRLYLPHVIHHFLRSQSLKSQSGNASDRGPKPRCETHLLKTHRDKAFSVSPASTMCQTAFHHWLNCVITSPVCICGRMAGEWLGNGSAHTLARVLKSYRTCAALYTDPGQKLSALRLKLTVSDKNSMGPGERRYCANDIICILERAFQNSPSLSLSGNPFLSVKSISAA